MMGNVAEATRKQAAAAVTEAPWGDVTTEVVTQMTPAQRDELRDLAIKVSRGHTDR